MNHRASLPWAVRFAFLFAIAPLLGVCTGRPGAETWGGDATFAPGWERIGKAALSAATDPLTWGQAIGAAAVQIGDLDNEIADWANDETPLFGLRARALALRPPATGCASPDSRTISALASRRR